MIKATGQSFLVNDFTFGMDWGSPPAMVQLGWVVDAKNMNLTFFKALEKRGGMDLLYPTAYNSGASISGLYEYKAPNGTDYLMVFSGTSCGYYDSGWHDIQTGLTSGLRPSCATMNGYCFVCNGTNANWKLYNTTHYDTVGIAAPTVTCPTPAEGTGVVSGNYYYKYAYYRSSDGFISNPSPASANVTPDGHSMTATFDASMLSGDADVTNIYLYRTLDLGDEDNSATQYYYAGSRANTAGTIVDNNSDNALTVLLELDNTKPPLAKFCLIHKDRMIYANCPNETSGGSLFMFSKVGKPEAVPSSYYQYFDRQDGNDITGIASLPDFLLIFKKNKIAVMEGNFEQWYTISNGIGCIAPWAIVTLSDKVAFISEEGWKCTDGRFVYDIGKKIAPISRAEYLTESAAGEYTATYYPEIKQMQFLLYHASFNNFVLCGHWLSALYGEASAEFTVGENYVGWVYHEYDNHALHTLSSFTNDSGITKPVAGSTTGFVYELDSGTDDEGEDIEFSITTGWFSLIQSPGLTKTIRQLSTIYAANNTGTVKLYIDVDFANNTEYITLTGGGGSYAGYAYSNLAYAGVDEMQVENHDIDESACGKMFRFRLTDSSGNSFILMSIEALFRVEGIR